MYFRTDLDRDTVIQRVRYLTNRLQAFGSPQEDADPLQELGDELAMVQGREGAVILRFPLEEQKGIVVSLDIDAAFNPHSSISDCAKRPENESISFGSETGTKGPFMSIFPAEDLGGHCSFTGEIIPIRMILGEPTLGTVLDLLRDEGCPSAVSSRAGSTSTARI